MFKPRKKENKTLSEIKSYLTTQALIKIGLLTALTIAYGEYCLNRVSLGPFIFFILLNVLWDITKLGCPNSDLFKKIYPYYLVFAELITLLCLMCVNSSLGYAPYSLTILIVLLIFLFAVFTPVFLNPNNKKELKNRLLNLISCFIVFGLIATLFYVCVNGYPLWVITLVLVLNILHLVFMILFDPTKEDSEKSKKDRKRLLLWGFPIGILYVIIILSLVFSEISVPPFLKTIVLLIGFGLGYILPQKF
ncbi:MAG: hypothetical protein J5594_02815 [Elusimicrobiaceae bacterium]|nr:hypothetical protein [Elusimicrobiaceae bacterium]